LTKDLTMKRLFILSSLLLTQTLFATHLSIYDSGMALVEEEKSFHFDTQTETLLYEDIAQSILTDSIAVTLPKNINLQAINFQRSNLSLHTLAQAFVGKKVYYKNKSYKLTAINASDAFIQKDGPITPVNLRELSYPFVPKMLHSKNALLLKIKQSYKTEAKVKLRYLANKINFTSDYTLELNKKSAELTGWVSITNNTNKEFRDANVQLLAGDLHRVRKAVEHPVMYKTMTISNDAPVASTMPSHKSMQGYHLYTIPFKVNIKPQESNRIKLLEKKSIHYTKSFHLRASNPLYLMGERSMQATQSIAFKLADTALPKGIVRIYSQAQKEQPSLLLGEATIQNSAKNRAITLDIGKDFDTKLTQRLIKRKDTKTKLDAIIEYTLTNNADKAKKISVTIPFTPRSDAKIITDEAYRYTKGNLATFTLTVEANSQKSFVAEFINKRR